MEAVAGEIWNITGQRRGLCVHRLAEHHPADVRPPRTFFGCVRIAGVVAVLVMDAMNGYPKDWSTFKRERCANSEQILNPLWSLKTTMCKQAVVADANAEVDSQNPQDGGHCQTAPTEVEEGCNRADVEGADEAGRHPIDSATVGFTAHADFFTYWGAIGSGDPGVSARG